MGQDVGFSSGSSSPLSRATAESSDPCRSCREQPGEGRTGIVRPGSHPQFAKPCKPRAEDGFSGVKLMRTHGKPTVFGEGLLTSVKSALQPLMSGFGVPSEQNYPQGGPEELGSGSGGSEGCKN